MRGFYYERDLTSIGNAIVKARDTLMTCLLGLALFSGCGGDGKTDATNERLKAMAGGQLKDVVPVKGVVNIDGSPAAGVNIFLYRQDSNFAIKESRTDPDGKYCWSTNLGCDGLEPGEYLLGFTHVPKPKKNGTGVDLFKGKYQDPKKNKITLKVEKGSPQEKADYDLVTKK